MASDSIENIVWDRMYLQSGSGITNLCADVYQQLRMRLSVVSTYNTSYTASMVSI